MWMQTCRRFIVAPLSAKLLPQDRPGCRSRCPPMWWPRPSPRPGRGLCAVVDRFSASKPSSPCSAAGRGVFRCYAQAPARRSGRRLKCQLSRARAFACAWCGTRATRPMTALLVAARIKRRRRVTGAERRERRPSGAASLSVSCLSLAHCVSYPPSLPGGVPLGGVGAPWGAAGPFFSVLSADLLSALLPSRPGRPAGRANPS